MDNQHIVIGIREHWGQKLPAVLSHRDRRQHLYTIGKSGAGKTTLLRNLILQDIEAGRGVGVIDPHGDLATDLLDHIPRNRIEDVVYFNPADVDYLPRLLGQKSHLDSLSYVNQGSSPGHEVQHWLAAEAELIAERTRTRVHGFHNQT
jgi:hypothetical protein